MKVLVINAGSSSLKYQLMDPETGKVFAKGLCERIGLDGKFTYKPQVEGKETIKAADVAMPTHSEAIQTVLNALVDPQNGVISSMKEIDAVGHRVVHGGETFASSVLINDEVLKAVEDCTPLAPLHNPANIIGIEACRKVLGDDVPQVAVFDTAFHQTMPELLTGPCGGYPAPPPVQQGKARLPLQTVHQPADTGGGVAQRLGGSGQTSLVEYSEQNPAFFGVHEISLLL